MNEENKLVKREESVGEIDRSMDEASSNRPSAYGYGDVAPDAEVHLLDYWRAVRKRLWLVIGVAAVISTLATIYAARKPDVYEASSRVQVDTEVNPMYAGKDSNDYNPGMDPAYFNTQSQIWTGPSLMRRVVRTLQLYHNQ